MRICALSVPEFRHAGIIVGANWTELETKKLEDRQRIALRDYVGRFIQIHPADLDQLAGLKFEMGEDGRLVDVSAIGKADAKKKADDAKSPPPTSNTKTDAPKGDASGKADAKKEA